MVGGIDLTCSSPNTCDGACPAARRVGLCGGGAGYCCAPATVGSPPVFSTPFTFTNPVAFTTVNDLFTRILTFLRTVIVLLALIFLVIGGFLYITSAGDEGKAETGKKCVLGALIGLALGIAAPTFLKELYAILGTGGAPTASSLLQIASNILSFLLTIIGILTLIMLVIGGIMYLTAAGDEDRIDRGKKLVKYSLIGITLALASLVLVRQLGVLLG